MDIMKWEFKKSKSCQKNTIAFFDRATRSVDNGNVKLQMQSISILVKGLIVSHEIFHLELIEIGFAMNLLLSGQMAQKAADIK